MTNRARGSMSGLFVCLTMSLMALLGLVVEGGRVVNCYGHLASLAESAVRVGGQEIVGIQSGEIEIDKLRARQLVIEYLGLHGVSGDVRVDGVHISVSISQSVKTPFLRILGVSSRTVTVTRSAAVTKG